MADGHWKDRLTFDDWEGKTVSISGFRRVWFVMWVFTPQHSKLITTFDLTLWSNDSVRRFTTLLDLPLARSILLACARETQLIGRLADGPTVCYDDGLSVSTLDIFVSLEVRRRTLCKNKYRCEPNCFPLSFEICESVQRIKNAHTYQVFHDMSC